MKKYICGVVTGVVIASVIGVGAAGIWDNIDVLKNDINVVVNGENITADNFLYQDTTYLPLRAVSEALGANVEYDEAANTAYIEERKEDNIMKSKYTPPDELINWDIKIACEDSIYYILVDYIIELAENKGLKTDGSIGNENTTLTIDGKSWTMKLLSNGWYYIPYDTYVDEIEPLLK